MRFQLSLFAQRLVANKMQQAIRTDNEYSAVLFALKMSMMEIFRSGWDESNSLAKPEDIQDADHGPDALSAWFEARIRARARGQLAAARMRAILTQAHAHTHARMCTRALRAYTHTHTHTHTQA